MIGNVRQGGVTLLEMWNVTSRHSDISVSREATVNPSKSNVILDFVPITRAEQSPTLFGHIDTDACGAREAQWKVQGGMDVRALSLR